MTAKSSVVRLDPRVVDRQEVSREPPVAGRLEDGCKCLIPYPRWLPTADEDVCRKGQRGWAVRGQVRRRRSTRVVRLGGRRSCVRKAWKRRSARQGEGTRAARRASARVPRTAGPVSNSTALTPRRCAPCPAVDTLERQHVLAVGAALGPVLRNGWAAQVDSFCSTGKFIGGFSAECQADHNCAANEFSATLEERDPDRGYNGTFTRAAM